jgi:SurA N-terminal domain
VLRSSMKLAVAGLAVGLAVCSCGSVKMGAAAIVGNQRISAATLAAQSANLSAGYQTYKKKKAQIQYPASEIPQQALSWLLRFRIRDALAAREGITVTPAQTQQALAAITAQVRQSGLASIAEAAVASGLPPDLIPALGTYQAIGNALASRFDGGKTPKSTAAQNALNTRLTTAQCFASKSLNIKVNPQFGVFDYGQLSVVPAKSSLSATQPAAGPSSATPAAQLNAPC